ncbi:TauD/TfdA dioxygenase family protein [Bordetella petrii]|uniref:TauD/TfdA dioxygenase family protein n=1 Tax=Bordetella petrii TaxID=94624 RepID=UPI001E38D7DE|nr:TauD/TfdA family dioxygenase [Bordetella petrii]MCD0502309.1 TauD/TfdA family dioxygenase [Bordetella petrii]
MLDLTPVADDFVAEVAGIDLTQPLSAELQQALRDALDKYAVLVIPDQPLDEAQQLRVAAIYGPLETSVGTYTASEKKPRRLGHAQLSDISNLDEQGKVIGDNDIRRLVLLSNQLWHTDSSFKKTPASASLLNAQEVSPVGGATEFADMRAAWDHLEPVTQAQIKDLIAVHDYFHSRSLLGLEAQAIPPEWRERQPPVKQVLVRNNTHNQRRSLYLASHIKSIEGMSEQDGRALLDRLMAFSTQPQFVYRHRWRAHDLVIWDNRCTMHRGTNYNQKYRRAMRRATAQDVGPTVSMQ